jgi:DNA-binding CsgD family transcriptional regulator
MVNIDNLTVVYLIGLVSLSYGFVQALTLRDEYHSSRIWALAQILFGLGFVGLVYFGKAPLPKYWIGSYALLVLAALTQLTAIARFGKNPIPKIPAAGCLLGLVAVIFLFESTRSLGAPLASLETFLFAPLAAIYIYMAWFSGKMGRISNSLYLKMSSGVFWVYAALMVLTLFLSLFGLGEGLIDTSSTEIAILALASLALSLVTNYLWSIQAAELSQTDINLVNFDIALEAKAKAVPVFIAAPSKKGQSKQPKKDIKELKAELKKDSIYSGDSLEKSEKADKADKSEKASKAPALKQALVNPDQMTISEQEALLALLTDREREVFLLAADGMKNGQIAEALSSAESSIKVHRSRMSSKLAISNVEGLAKLKKNLGLGAALIVAESKAGQELTPQPSATLSQGATDIPLSEKSNPTDGA